MFLLNRRLSSSITRALCCFNKNEKCSKNVQMDIEGKCALITNGASSVGFELAKQLLKRKAANIVITGKGKLEEENMVKVLNELHGKDKVTYFKMNDSSDIHKYEDLFKFMKEKYNSIDIMINNGLTINLKDDLINNNSISIIHGMESARRFMKDGLIVNHTSALGLNPNPKMLEYSAASAAVINASLAFGNDVHFNKTNTTTLTFCSEPIDEALLYSSEPLSTEKSKTEKPDIVNNCALSMAKSMLHIIECGPRNSIWLWERNGTLSEIEMLRTFQYTAKIEL